MPNGSAFKINWELLMFPKGMSGEVADDLEVKRQKMVHFFPRYVCLKSSVHSPSSINHLVTENHDFNLDIYKAENEDAWISSNLLGGGVNEDDKKLDQIDRSKRWDKFSPWGSGDAKAAADSVREETDTSMALGEQYMVGSALATVYQETDANIWTPFPVNGKYEGKSYKMKVDEP